MSAVLSQLPNGWRASLQLGFRHTPNRTVLADRVREGPLAVQRALYPEGDLCHCYLLHPPGGVAGGDSLTIGVEVSAGASALITTPGAGKFYHSIGPTAEQSQHLVIDGGSLEWLPQENIFFPGARTVLKTTVELRGEAAFIGWEVNCLGRPVIGEQFDTGSMRSDFKLYRDGVPLLQERLQVDGPADLAAAAGLRGHPVVGTFWSAPAAGRLLDQARAAVHAEELAITLVDGLLIARYLGSSTEQARRGFARLWQALRPQLLHRRPCAPRIWNT